MFGQSFAAKFVTMCFGKSVSFFSTKVEIHNILATHLKADDKVMSKLDDINIEKIIQIIPRNQIIRNCATIKNLDISLEEMNYLSHCLTIEPMVLKNRILILKEMGVKRIGLRHIYRFPGSMRKSIARFKECHDIPAEENIMKTIFINMDLQNHSSIISPSSMMFVNNVNRTGDYYKMCMSYYKTVYLKLCDELFHKNRKLKYQSFRELSKLLHILISECQFDMEFLKKNPFLLNLDVDKVKEFLNTFKYIEIRGKGIIDIIRKHPRILLCDLDNTKELLKLYKVLDLSDQSLFSYLHVLHMNKQTFLERYSNILKRHELALWLKHPRIWPMIYRYKMVLNRVNYLQSINYLRNANINTYLSPEKIFLRFLEGDIPRTAMRKSLLYIFRKELGEDKIYVINSIQRHPYWKHVSLLHIETMLRYLKKSYKVEDICQNIHIILYARSEVINALNFIYKEYSPQDGYDFTPTQYLAMCLYRLEKRYHFSGDAIWQTLNSDMSVINPHIFVDTEPNESDQL